MTLKAVQTRKAPKRKYDGSIELLRPSSRDLVTNGHMQSRDSIQ